VQPKLIVAMGATAAMALTGDGTRVTARGGQSERGLHGVPVLVTVHPSHILRVRDRERRVRVEAALVADLRRARDMVAVEPFVSLAALPASGT
ncbi:MAG: uracil-DNA glycosylase family protein, partial [Pseudomonadota bacterium]